MTRPTLDELGIKHGCDKASTVSMDWQWAVNYLHRYDQLFTVLRDEPITLLELGWGEYDPETGRHDNPNLGGRSAAMWREYFPNATIAVIDIEHKTNTVDGVHLYQGAQDDPQFLAGIHDELGDFDIIIDDASHISSKTIASFRILWPYLKPGGGLYCVEDLHTSYHPWWHGAGEASMDPDKPCPMTNQPTAMQWLKRLADDANYRGQRLHGPDPDDLNTDWDCYPQRFWRGYTVDSVTFAYNLCIITKAAA